MAVIPMLDVLIWMKYFPPQERLPYIVLQLYN